MKFNLYTPPHASIVVRIYAIGFNGAGIGKSSGNNPLSVTKGKSGTDADVAKIENFLSSQGVDLTSIFSLKDLCEELQSRGLVRENVKPGRKSKKAINSVIDNVEIGNPSRPNNSYIPVYRELSLSELSQATNAFDITNTPILKKTLKNLVFQVDYREPKEIIETLKLTGAKVEIVELKEEADFKVTLLNDSSREMIFERKRITDLGNSIMDDEHHAHDQVERYSLYREKRQREGCHVAVYWISEYENSGEISLYNALNYTQGMDGWLNYVQAINGQQHIHSLNMYHTACLIFKFAQGFFEQELRKKVTFGLKGKRIDKTKDERQLIHQQLSGDHGVTRPSQGVSGMLAALPGISSKVAKSLASTGKSMPEIMNMPLNEMILLDGIGKKTAEHMINLFNCRDV